MPLTPKFQELAQIIDIEVVKKSQIYAKKFAYLVLLTVVFYPACQEAMQHE